ncbi:MAG: hypothetical protein ACQET8_23095 [Bacillota bacterium]
MKVTNLLLLCDVCSSPNVFDENYETNIRYIAWVKCSYCRQKMWLTDEVKRSSYEK